MPSDLLSRAQRGDEDAFGVLVEPHRRELFAHCYRMLGSALDAEDALQESLLAAWRGLPGFDGRSSVRTWLFRVTTNTCLNALRTAKRRPQKAWDIEGVHPPAPTRLGEVPWLGPVPDALVDGLAKGPEAAYSQRESISLAFVVALQTLPPGQLAALLLRDVMGFRAAEVADLLDTSVSSVESSLKRARAGLESRRARRHSVEGAPAAGSPAEARIAEQFARAYEAADVEGLVGLLTDDVFVAMPPLPLEYDGRAAAAEFFASLLGSGRRYSLVPTRANGSPAFGSYVAGRDGWTASGLFVVDIAANGIARMTRFEAHELPLFGLPPTLRQEG